MEVTDVPVLVCVKVEVRVADVSVIVLGRLRAKPFQVVRGVYTLIRP